MSAGAILVTPVVVPAAAAVGAATGAALTIRASRAGVVAAGRALERFVDDLERRSGAQDDREEQARRWETAAAATVAVNQELRLLAARARRVGVATTLPEPLRLTDQRLEDVRAWVRTTRQGLRAARAAIERAEAERERRVLVAKLPIPADETVTAADVLAEFASALAGRTGRGPGRSPAAAASPSAPKRRGSRVDKRRVDAEIAAILARLDPDATAQERERVVLAAARVRRQRDPGARRTFLAALARTVDDDINPTVARRRDAATWLDAMEHPEVVETVDDGVPPFPYHELVDRLRAVVRGDADLTDEIRAAVTDALAWAEREVARRRLLEAMAETFRGLGYSVTTEARSHHTTLSVARAGWRGEHSADVWVDEAGDVRWQLVELAPDARGEASRCEDVNRSMSAACDELTRRGFDATLRTPDPPARAVPRHDGTRRRADDELADEDVGVAYRHVNPSER